MNAPVLLVQGTGDEYGATAQLDAIDSRVRGHVERVELTGAGHVVHLDAPAATVDTVARFVIEAADDHFVDDHLASEPRP